ncbi:uncharacterized protein LOC131994802 [Stomoxys calcitrans]|uniref:uncharacterized protein LOC131994802 n=1 Tax=Stomoxys calcitrans TaxID=35570 RepID=UPI0027E27B66|nr:uncharacterized protein LOC131994802 [Stomoxys calcitrans]
MVTAEMESEERMKFTALYLDVKAKLTRQMNSIRRLESNPRSSTVRQFSVDGGPFSENSSSTRKTRLPEIQLPKFGGAYADWPNFFSLFSTIVDSSAELSDLEKFHHLRSSLTGAALDTISSLELNERNYMEAVKLLKNRFDNKLLNFQTHIKAIFSLKAVEVSPAIGLRQLSDKFNSHLRAMQTIASRDQIADGLLVYLAATKMNRDSQIKWEESLAVNELPSWQSMSSFLEQRCRMLENLENSVVCAGSIQQNNKKQSFKNRHVHVASGSSSPLCAFCDSMDHYIVNCPPFSNLSPSLRFKEAKRLKLCLNCLRKGHVLKKCNSGSCRQCSSKHHTMLHMDQTPSAQPSVVVEPSISQSVLVSSADSSGRSATTGGTVLLATAIVLAKNKFGNFVPCRAILDSASQLNMIANRFAKTLGLNCNRVSATVYGIGDGSMLVEKSVDLVVKSCHSDFTTSFAAMVVPSITDYKPKINLDASNWNMPKNIQLADPAFNKPDHIDMLIGAELFFNLMSVGQIKIGVNLPVLQKTLFGWVVAGGSFQPCKSWSLAVSYSELEEEEEKLSTVVKSFWEIETNFVYDESRSDNELYCENHFLTNFVRLPSGSYSVRLPQIEGRGVSSLGGSYQRALQRLMSLERKFRRSPEIKAQYTTFMREYATLSHMSLISPQVPESKYYLPHHCVHKLDSTSTKLRVVFDGSAKTATGLSLNDILHSGPTIQPKLFNTLVRYRFFKVALSGDICKMYRCVRVSHPDDYLQCILWRENEADDIKTYKLNTVTYGTKPAAFLAIRAMHQLAIDEEENFPLGSKVVRRDFYVDDMLSGGNTIAEVEEIRHQVTALLKKGEFLIRKWCSNDPDALRDVPAEDCETLLKFHDGTDVTKTLGLTWDPQSDNFIFSFTPIDDWKVVTKRSILSSIARLYDPLGLIGPVITKAKMFMQHLWKLNLQWDESLPQSLHSLWIEYISKFDLMHRFTFPRHVSMASASLQIHGFCDASLAAYGACVYLVHFSEEYKALKSDKEIASSSKLYSLAPIIDEFGLIRVGGRLQNSTLDFDARHPIILPKKHPFTASMATHLEVVQDLSTPSFLCSLRRFVATRGKPKTIWSDNASNFVGAKNELDELKQMFSRQSHLNAIHDQCLDDGIDWKFIPPRSPHFGGLWEAAVKSAKFHFYRAVGLNKLTFDELRTLVCQISAILNSRPLCPLSEDPEDLDVLTPGHFLVGGPLISIPEPNMSWINFGRLNSWQKVSELQQIFWRKWSTSYLTLLQERSKWQAQSDNISVGAMVVIKDENLPPLKWQMGRVEETIKGEDGIVRVVNVRTSSGIFKRAITKLAVLPISESVEAPRPSTGGGC